MGNFRWIQIIRQLIKYMNNIKSEEQFRCQVWEPILSHFIKSSMFVAYSRYSFNHSLGDAKPSLRIGVWPFAILLFLTHLVKELVWEVQNQKVATISSCRVTSLFSSCRLNVLKSLIK